MRQKLDIWQTNMLLTGKPLGAEVAAPTENHRAFLSVSSYCEGPDQGKRPSIFLNGDHSDVRFELRVVEVANEYVGNPVVGWDWDLYERELAAQSEITSIDELEQVLRSYLDDFSSLIRESKLAW